MDRRKTVRSFLQAAVTTVPKAADIEEAGLGGTLLGATRRWAALVNVAARPEPGSRNGQRAAELIEEATDALLAALPSDWEAPSEDPIALANTVPRGGYPG